jgi:hypothetical protein
VFRVSVCVCVCVCLLAQPVILSAWSVCYLLSLLGGGRLSRFTVHPKIASVELSVLFCLKKKAFLSSYFSVSSLVIWFCELRELYILK